MSTSPVSLGQRIESEHTCNGANHSAPMTIDRVTEMGGITGSWRVEGIRCDGSAMFLLLDDNGTVLA